MAASSKECATAKALNSFSLYSPSDQQELEAVMEDYFTSREDDEDEPSLKFNGNSFFFFFIIQCIFHLILQTWKVWKKIVIVIIWMKCSSMMLW